MGQWGSGAELSKAKGDEGMSGVQSNRIFEPDFPECDSTAVWHLRLRKDDLSGEHEVEIKLWRRDGKAATIRFAAADRLEPMKVLKILSSHNARLPENKIDARGFVESLLQAIPAEAVISTIKPGWRDECRGFVMPDRFYGTCAGTTIWDRDKETGRFGEIAGSLDAYRSGVLDRALQSTYVTNAILIGLAAPLLTYVKVRCGRRLLPESAFFHWAGITSSGKSTLARVTQSVIGAPGEMGDYRTSERGAAEANYGRNDLVVIFDEAEHDDTSDAVTLAQMKLFSRSVTAGQSKRTSRIHRDTLPELQWDCLGVSSGPVTQAELARRLGKARQGQAARFFDLTVPPPELGGIVDRMIAHQGGSCLSVQSEGFVRLLDASVEANHGVLLDAWILHLLDQDVAEQIEQLTVKIASKLSDGLGGLDGRMARKFAVLGAAGHVAIDAGLLPWTKDWVDHCVGSAYRNALENRDPDRQQLYRAAQALEAALKNRKRFPFVRPSARGVPAFDFPAEALGFVVVEGDRKRGYLVPERLGLIGLNDGGMQRRLLNLVVAEKNRQKSYQFRTRDGGGG